MTERSHQEGPVRRDQIVGINTWIRVQTQVLRLSSVEAAALHAQAPFLADRLAPGQRLGVNAPPSTSSLPKATRVASLVNRAVRAFLQSAAARAPDLALVELQPNATRTVLPVSTRLRAQGTDCHFLVLLRDDASQRLLAEQGFSFDTVEAFLRPSDFLRAQRLHRRLKRGMDFGSVEHLFGANTDSDTPSARPQLTAELLKRTSRTFLLAAATERWLQRRMPQGVLFSTNRSMMNQLLHQHAHRTKRIFLLQGLVPPIPPVGEPLDVDLALIGSVIDQDYANRCSLPPSRTMLIGYPDYDTFPSLDRNRARAELRHALGLTHDHSVMVFTSQYATEGFPEAARLRNLATVITAANSMPQTHFALKLHPRRERLPDAFLSDAPSNLTLLEGLDTPTALLGSDVAATFWSTTALEAILLGTPLVQLNATGLPDYLDLSTPLHRPWARTSDDLATAVGQLLFDTDVRRNYEVARTDFLATQQLTIDGQAAARASDAIMTALAP